MALVFTTNLPEDALSLFRYYKKIADGALAQIGDDAFFHALGPEENSVAQVVKHLGGNLCSRWTDFLASDGEKPWRNRDAEFEIVSGDTRASLMVTWEEGWSALLGTLEGLTEADLARRITIRGEVHSVVQAINRALAHCAYHIGQITFLAKHLAGNEWKTLTIPKGRSAEFTRRVQQGEASQR